MEKQNMKVLIIEDNKNPIIKVIPNRLDTLRKIVGNNHIEVVKYKDILLVFDEDAYKKLLPVNREIDGLNIRGIFVITGNDKNPIVINGSSTTQPISFAALFNASDCSVT